MKSQVLLADIGQGSRPEGPPTERAVVLSVLHVENCASSNMGLGHTTPLSLAYNTFGLLIFCGHAYTQYRSAYARVSSGYVNVCVQCINMYISAHTRSICIHKHVRVYTHTT